MNKTIPILIVLLVVIVLGGILLLKNNWSEQVSEDLTFSHTSGLEISFPKEWEGKYQTDTDQGGIAFNYLDSSGNKSLLFLLTLYPQTENMSDIEQLPNHKIVFQNEEFMVSQSIPLDMPYQTGTEDFENYTVMLEQVEEVINNLRDRDLVSVLNKEVNEYQDEEPKYTIEVDYPELPEAEEMNTKIKDLAQSKIDTFKENLNEWGSPEFGGDFSSSLWLWYKPMLLSDKLISVKFFMSDYFAGAAHPNNYTFSFNYDLEKKAEIEMADLFSVAQDEYLSLLDPIVRQKLEEIFEEREIMGFLEDDKAVINEETTVNLTRDGLLFSFDPYQVAAYAAGSFEVLVSYQEIEEILKIKP